MKAWRTISVRGRQLAGASPLKRVTPSPCRSLASVVVSQTHHRLAMKHFGLSTDFVSCQPCTRAPGIATRRYFSNNSPDDDNNTDSQPKLQVTSDHETVTLEIPGTGKQSSGRGGAFDRDLLSKCEFTNAHDSLDTCRCVWIRGGAHNLSQSRGQREFEWTSAVDENKDNGVDRSGRQRQNPEIDAHSNFAGQRSPS